MELKESYWSRRVIENAGELARQVVRIVGFPILFPALWTEHRLWMRSRALAIRRKIASQDTQVHLAQRQRCNEDKSGGKEYTVPSV